MVISAAAFVRLRKSLSDPHVASVVFTTQQGMHGKKNCVKHFIYFFFFVRLEKHSVTPSHILFKEDLGCFPRTSCKTCLSILKIEFRWKGWS